MLLLPIFQSAEHKCLEAVNTEDSEYAVAINVGNPPFQMQVAPDTGSYELVLASQACFNCEARCMGCPEHRLFDTNRSTSFQNLHRRYVAAYGQGQVTGFVGSDFILLGNWTATRPQTMDLIVNNEMEGFSTDSSYDGILGMGVTYAVPLGNSTEFVPSTLATLGIRLA